MRRLTARIDSILDDLRTNLESELADTDESWPVIIEYAMSEAWDALKKTEPDTGPETTEPRT